MTKKRSCLIRFWKPRHIGMYKWRLWTQIVNTDVHTHVEPNRTCHTSPLDCRQDQGWTNIGTHSKAINWCVSYGKFQSILGLIGKVMLFKSDRYIKFIGWNSWKMRQSRSPLTFWGLSPTPPWHYRVQGPHCSYAVSGRPVSEIDICLNIK